MSDLFDRFVGGAGAVTGHTADSGDTWGPSGTTMSIDGSGSLYSPAPSTPVHDLIAASTWTPPGTDYAVACVFGAGFRQSGIGSVGVCLRLTSTSLQDWDAYLVFISPATPDSLQVYRLTSSGTSYSLSYLIGSLALASQIATGDTLTVTIAGVVTPQFTVYINGTQVYQISDTTGPAITGAGSAGVIIQASGSAPTTDVLRTVWAGAIGGPAEGITPSTATVAVLGTHSFSATGGLPNETLNWTATHGSESPTTGTTVTYTAPGSGSSDAATWTSVDLPKHTASAAITLTGAATATPSRGGSARRRRDPSRLDFPLVSPPLKSTKPARGGRI